LLAIDGHGECHITNKQVFMLLVKISIYEVIELQAVTIFDYEGAW